MYLGFAYTANLFTSRLNQYAKCYIFREIPSFWSFLINLVYNNSNNNVSTTSNDAINSWKINFDSNTDLLSENIIWINTSYELYKSSYCFLAV